MRERAMKRGANCTARCRTACCWASPATRASWPNAWSIRHFAVATSTPDSSPSTWARHWPAPAPTAPRWPPPRLLLPAGRGIAPPPLAHPRPAPSPDTPTGPPAALAAAGWPWQGATRLGHAVAPVDLEMGRRRWHVQLQAADDSVDVTVRQEAQVDSVRLALVRKHGDSVWWLEGNGQMQRVVQARNSAGIHLHSAGRAWCFVPVDPRRARAQDGGSGAVTAPLTGRIAAVGVAVGDTVQAGQTLVVLEAMKMEHRLSAPFAGRITELSAQVGGQARAGSKLAQVQPLGIGAAA